MRIDEIVLHNFGPYRGEQKADLRPPSPDKPVILFGGLNGAGKTTVLEAIQLALYGNLAEPARRSGLAYDEYLRRAANRSAPPGEGAAVGLAFSVHELGHAKTYRLRRTWSVASSSARKTRESLDVWVNGEHDAALSEAWPDQVAQFLPPRLAPLFFFDGERIEQLADPEQSAAALQTAVGALLGADLVDQTGTDLDAVLRRRRVERAAESDKRLPEAEAALEAAEARRQVAIQQVAAARAALDRALELSRRADQRYAEQGGRAADERRATEAARAAVQGERLAIEHAMATLASGDLPLALVLPILRQTTASLEKQATIAERQAAIGVLREAAARLERELNAANAAARTLQLVKEWAIRETEMPVGDTTTFPDVGPSLARFRHLLNGSLASEVEACRELLTRHGAASARLEEIDRSLAMTPDADAIKDAADARTTALVEVGARQQEHSAAQAKAGEIARDVEQRRRDLDKLLEADRIARGEASDAERFTRHAIGVKLALGRFGARLRRRHLERLEKLILECYRALIHKTDLARGLRIDPESYTIRLTDVAGAEVRPERLSAGERQLLAVSILWAMARASGRPLPVAIDTPLGRLDGLHRRQLVERYFPHAAGQVLLLSTDEEVDPALYEILGPFVGRAYRLDHDEVGGTRISPGYPFAGATIVDGNQKVHA